MTNEEKARAYDEALERARKIHDQILNNELIGFPDQIREIFPQLRESEDERIKKDIINLIYWLKANPSLCSQYYKDRYDGILDWLEKQKEQKPWKVGANAYFTPEQNSVEFTHHETNESLKDAVTHQMEDDGDVDDFVRRGIDDIALKYAELGAKWQKEQKQEWSEEDEKNRRSLNTKEIKVGDTITYFRNGKKGIMLVSSFDSGIYPRCKWGITDIDGTAYGDWTPGSGPYYAATEKEKQQLYDTMPIEVKNWLKSLRPQPKQEWSEENERKLQKCIKIVERWEEDYDIAYAPYSGMLKSLRPQSH